MKFSLQHCQVNPTLEYAESIVVPEGTTEIVAQGGGSTLDVGKWLAHKYDLPLTVIPTTCGTGSEVTRYCVLMVDGKKKTFDLELPKNYVLDSRLLETLPRQVLVSSALDSLSQAFEANWSKNATDESRNYAHMAINLVLMNLLPAIKYYDDNRWRMNLLIAANFSGRAIEITKTNVCHAISYPLTEMYGIPHGIACAMTLPYFIKKWNGIDLTEFIKECELPEYKIDVNKVAGIAIKNKKLDDCLLKVEKVDIKQALHGII